MDTFNVKKRNVLSYDEFVKNKVTVKKGEHDIVDSAMPGDKKGKDGVAVIDEAKKELVSDCCGCMPAASEDGKDDLRDGLCSCCGEHCEYVEPEAANEAASASPVRSLSEIAREIRSDWKNVNYAAKPYLEAMAELDTMQDMYGSDSADSIVGYFLNNASSWRGEVAKRVKKELNGMRRR